MGGTAASRLTSFGTSGTALGVIGGAQNQVIAQANLPNVAFTGAAVGVSASGSYSGTTSTVSNDHTHGFSGTTGGMNSSDPHSHTFSPNPTVAGGSRGSGVGGGGLYGVATSASIGATSINHTHNYSGNTGGISANHTHTYSGSVGVSGSTAGLSVNSGGSGTSFSLIQPTIILNRILRVL